MGKVRSGKKSEKRWLERRIGYVFNDSNLLRRALSVPGKSNSQDYEVLEFFGDAALRYVVPRLLIERYGKLSQSDLARMTSAITCNANLAHLAVRLEVYQHINFGSARPYFHLKLMADVFEAIIGAIDKDAGINTVEKLCRRLLRLSIELAQFDNPTDQLISLMKANGGKDKVTYQIYPLADGIRLRSFLVAVKHGKQTIARGEGVRSEWAMHNAAGLALLTLFPERFPSNLPSHSWQIKAIKVKGK